MTGIQMLLVLFAVVLFSTILLTTYNNLFDQTELAYRSMYVLEGQKVADCYFQKIEANILGGNLEFDNLQNYCNNLDNSMVVDFGDQDTISYNITINSAYCDSTGNTSSPKVDYQIVDITIYTTPFGAADTIWIGTANNPLSKIYTDSGM